MSKNPSNTELRNMLTEMGAKDEEDLENKLLADWDLVSCFRCGKPVKLSQAKFVGDLPFHEYCA